MKSQSDNGVVATCGRSIILESSALSEPPCSIGTPVNPALSPPAIQIEIASTFTSDRMVRPLRFWMESLGINANVSIASYDQVMQELLNPESQFSRNSRGFNVLLLRLEDWIRNRLEAETPNNNLGHIQQVAHDFLTAIGVLRNCASASLLLFLCPSSSHLPAIYKNAVEDIYKELVARLGGMTNVHVWQHVDLVRLYPVTDHEDNRSDRVANIPYTEEYFVAIATLLARRMCALLKPRYKVIAVDCDNTLWKGVCGEDGPDGIELTPAHIQLQKLLVRQHESGVLICLCSRNNPSDVEAVFKHRLEMPLHEEHLVASRVNWDAKSVNLQSLASELGLSLDSFIFVDDSPLECEEVRTCCPSILTLQLPASLEEIGHFLAHVWAFDCVGITQEASRRTAHYRENRARDAARASAVNLEMFIASLELMVDVSSMEAQQLSRVAELVQRTNQFNLTSVRRRSADIEALSKSGDLHCLVVHVRDRFGDYGLVGTLFLRRDASVIDVDTFILSCRVLGRSVEYQILRELGHIARRECATSIMLRYRETARNRPAREFLERTFDQFRLQSKDVEHRMSEVVFLVPVEFLVELGGQTYTRALAHAPSPDAAVDNVEQAAPSLEWHDESYRLSRVSDILQEINGSTSRHLLATVSTARPSTSTAQAIAAIYAEVLGRDNIGVHDNFFQLGGSSLQAVDVIVMIESTLGLQISLLDLFEEPTIEAVATKLTSASRSDDSVS